MPVCQFFHSLNGCMCSQACMVALVVCVFVTRLSCACFSVLVHCGHVLALYAHFHLFCLHSDKRKLAEALLSILQTLIASDIGPPNSPTVEFRNAFFLTMQHVASYTNVNAVLLQLLLASPAAEVRVPRVSSQYSPSIRTLVCGYVHLCVLCTQPFPCAVYCTPCFRTQVCS